MEDIVIIGAGISGINLAYRVKERCKGKVSMFENRFDMGGTWDFFKYPGLRSDSDLHTLGFPWYPWPERYVIAEAPSIMKYIKAAAKHAGLDNIQYGHRLVAGDWSSEQQCWRLTFDVHDKEQFLQQKQVYTRWLLFGTGYYDYEQALDAEIPGLADFKGTTVHPQFWPEKLDYVDKRMVVIGSGATAVTLIPSLVDKAKSVTMVQRSPSYVVAIPRRNVVANFLRDWLPSAFSTIFIRLYLAAIGSLAVTFCLAFPNFVKRAIIGRTAKMLPATIKVDPHFIPNYFPWQQRMCLVPGGDFFKALKGGKADVATGIIKRVTTDGIELQSGQRIDADIIITATGLKLRVGGGAVLKVDGKEFKYNEHFSWRGVMMEGLPNAGYTLGYVNASWTLGCDTAAQHLCRLINSMQQKRQTSVVPYLANPDAVKESDTVSMNSTYFIKGKDAFPRSGDADSWKSRIGYFSDTWRSRFSSLEEGLRYTSEPRARM